MDKKLAGKVAVVAGATRGAGRGIACMLGEAGATVYCSGRSVRGGLASGERRPETIEETAEMVAAYGGTGIPVRVDHTDEAQVQALAGRVLAEQGRLDLLVNDVWGGDELVEWGRPFWELPPERMEQLYRRAVQSHIITSRYLAPMMVEQKAGLIIEVTDGESQDYRGHLHYDLVKASVIRLAYAMAQELRPYEVTALALTPGFLRSEAMLDHFGVTEANWRDGAQKDPHFIASETPCYIGRAVAALAADPQVFRKTGGAYSTWGLVDEYGFTDMDGSQPHWGRYFAGIK